MSDDWISVDEQLPKIGVLVDAIFLCHNETLKAVLVRGKDNFHFNNENGDYIHFAILQWRPIKEKIPDFSKLKDNDLIIIEIKTGEKLVGFVYLDRKYLPKS